MKIKQQLGNKILSNYTRQKSYRGDRIYLSPRFYIFYAVSRSCISRLTSSPSCVRVRAIPPLSEVEYALAPERRHYADEHIVRYLGEAVRDYHRLGAELVQRFLRDGAFAVAGDFQRVNASDGVRESREVAVSFTMSPAKRIRLPFCSARSASELSFSPIFL